ncbi:MAG: hypothetical protein KGL16_02325 [Acidobacteriota bacterium]|nr:hypothetical protein [Acidobacteriota bacterium]
MSQHGVRVLSGRDRELLRFVGEQYLVTLPQLAYLAGRSERTARWLRTRWQRAGLIDGGKLLVDEPTVIWLTRPGLAVLGLAWKTVRPRYASIPTLAVLVELRLAGREQYPQACWIPRRLLSHASPSPSPLPDAILTTSDATVAIVAKARELHRRELEQQVLPLIADYDRVLLVVPEAGRHTRQWFDELAGHASVLAHQRDPTCVTLPVLPTLAPLESPPTAEAGWPMPRRVDPYGDFPTSPHTDVV